MNIVDRVGSEVKQSGHSYAVLDRAQEITRTPELKILEARKYLGIPLANDLRRWLQEQPAMCLLYIDLRGARGVSTSVAEELGPLLMRSVHQSPGFQHRYPIYVIDNPDHAYTFAQAFASLNWSGPAPLKAGAEGATSIMPIARHDDRVAAVLGQLSGQMEQILRLADQRAATGESLTSEDLAELAFLADVSAAARSKRLTDLYSRRLLAFRENPRNSKERLFIPVWRLEGHEQFAAPQQLLRP